MSSSTHHPHNDEERRGPSTLLVDVTSKFQVLSIPGSDSVLLIKQTEGAETKPLNNRSNSNSNSSTSNDSPPLFTAAPRMGTDPSVVSSSYCAARDDILSTALRMHSCPNPQQPQQQRSVRKANNQTTETTTSNPKNKNNVTQEDSSKEFIANLVQQWIRFDQMSSNINNSAWYPLVAIDTWTSPQMLDFVDYLASAQPPLQQGTWNAIRALYGLKQQQQQQCDEAPSILVPATTTTPTTTTVVSEETTEVALGDVYEPDTVEECVNDKYVAPPPVTAPAPASGNSGATSASRMSIRDTPEALAAQWMNVDRCQGTTTCWLPLVNVHAWTPEQMVHFLDELIVRTADPQKIKPSTVLALNAMYNLSQSRHVEITVRYQRLLDLQSVAVAAEAAVEPHRHPESPRLSKESESSSPCKEEGRVIATTTTATSTPETIVSFASSSEEEERGLVVPQLQFFEESVVSGSSGAAPPPLRNVRPEQSTPVTESTTTPVETSAAVVDRMVSSVMTSNPNGVVVSVPAPQPKFAVSFADMAKQPAPPAKTTTSATTGATATQVAAAASMNAVAKQPNEEKTDRRPQSTMTTRFVPSLSAVVRTVKNHDHNNNGAAVKETTDRKRSKKKTAEMTEQEWQAAELSEQQLANRSQSSNSRSHTTTTPMVVMLVSMQSIQREVIANQEKAKSIFSAQGIPYELVDGSDPVNRDVRNNLFLVSGVGATTYPQFFVVKHGEMTFWGNWDELEWCNDRGILKERLGLPTTQTARTKGAGPVRQANDNSEEPPASMAPAPAASSDVTKSAASSAATSKTDRDKPTQNSAEEVVVSSGRKSDAVAAKSRKIVSDITIYGATSFVAKHALDYWMQISLTIPRQLKITLAGRDKAKINALHKTLSQKMSNLCTVNPGSKGKCVFDTFVADSSDSIALDKMAARTAIVANFAGPFAKYGDKVVAGCARAGTHYLDITGEVDWAGRMRLQHGDSAAKTEARLISLCGFDSVPSDLAVLAAVEELRRVAYRRVDVEQATTWHYAIGTANGGTIHTCLDMEVDWKTMLSQPVPFLLFDPLTLAYPRTRVDPNMQETKNRMAKAEWWNQLPSADSILGYGVSAPFFMAVANAKVVHASAVSLNYGTEFTYRERFLPMGFKMTRRMGLIALVPALLVQLGLLLLFVILKIPFFGKKLAHWLAPPGSGSPDFACKASFAEVYAEVTSTPGPDGLVNRGNCAIKFQGDPGNWVTAQCICEAALALLLNQTELPLRSLDGFGTPAELLGPVLLRRLKESPVRPVEVTVCARNNVPLREHQLFGHN